MRLPACDIIRGCLSSLLGEKIDYSITNIFFFLPIKTSLNKVACEEIIKLCRTVLVDYIDQP